MFEPLYSVPVHYSVMLRKLENKTRNQETSVLDAFIQCTPQKKVLNILLVVQFNQTSCYDFTFTL